MTRLMALLSVSALLLVVPGALADGGGVSALYTVSVDGTVQGPPTGLVSTTANSTDKSFHIIFGFDANNKVVRFNEGYYTEGDTTVNITGLLNAGAFHGNDQTAFIIDGGPEEAGPSDTIGIDISKGGIGFKLAAAPGASFFHKLRLYFREAPYNASQYDDPNYVYRKSYYLELDGPVPATSTFQFDEIGATSQESVEGFQCVKDSRAMRGDHVNGRVYESRLFPKVFIDSGMTILKCYDHAKAYNSSTFLLEWQSECWIRPAGMVWPPGSGDTYSDDFSLLYRYGPVLDGDGCNRACAGSTEFERQNALNCGGFYAASSYFIYDLRPTDPGY